MAGTDRTAFSRPSFHRDGERQKIEAKPKGKRERGRAHGGCVAERRPPRQASLVLLARPRVHPS